MQQNLPFVISPGVPAGTPCRRENWLIWDEVGLFSGQTIEKTFQTGKGLVGLDQHQVRRWRSWYRWTTLAMVAHAFLVVAAATDQALHLSPSGLIALTCNEVQHLFATLAAHPAGDLGYRLRWSLWRRRHQARARTCHYQRQANGP